MPCHAQPSPPPPSPAMPCHAVSRLLYYHAFVSTDDHAVLDHDVRIVPLAYDLEETLAPVLCSQRGELRLGFVVEQAAVLQEEELQRGVQSTGDAHRHAALL